MRIEELEALAAQQRERRMVEQGRGYDTSRDLNGNVTFHRAPSPQERIYNAVLATDGAVTRGQIAKAMGLKKTPWLTGLIEQLVADGILCRTHGTWKNGVLVYLYEARR